MNIAFDATAMLANMSKGRGIGIYASNLFEKMLECDRNNHYYCFNLYENNLENGWDERYENFCEYRQYSGYKIEVLRMDNCKELLGEIVKNFINEYNIDIFIITSPFDPAIMIYDKVWFGETKVISLVYDIIPFIFKEEYFKTYSIQKKYMKQVEMLKWSDACWAISYSTMMDLSNKLGVEKEKISVIGAGVNEKLFKNLKVKEDQKSEVLNKFGINNKFIMCTGGDDPRKNLDSLILAYSQIDKNLIKEYQLVVVCKISEKSKERYIKLVSELGIEERIVFTGYVDDRELVDLYNLATVMAFPSKYEGFGFPIVEAWRCGTAVLTSNNSSMVEVAGECAILVDPFSVKSIVVGLQEILKPQINEIMSAKGMKRSDEFKWEQVANNALCSINCFLQYNEQKVKKTVKHIAVFSPLPPIQSGISDYCVDIIWEISKKFYVDVFIDNGYEVTCALPDNVKVYKHYEFLDLKDKYDEIVYHVGNSEFHVYMIDYIREFKGVIVLHDYNLNGMVRKMIGNCSKQNYIQYKNFLLEDLYVDEVNRYLDRYLGDVSGGGVPDIELNGFITNYAKSIIVHSEYSKVKLKNKKPCKKVHKIPMYSPVEKDIEISNKKEIVFGAFGIVSEPKRILPLLKAFKRISDENEKVKLILVGRVLDSFREKYNLLVEKLDLHSKVILTGHVSFDEFNDYMNWVDVGINLRYPYHGENSASLARLLGRGKCVIINDVGSFSEYPDDVCVKIPSVEFLTEKREVECIYEAMQITLNECYRKEVARNAYNYAKEQMDVSVIGKMYVDVIEDNQIYEYTEREIKEYIKKTLF